MPLLAKEASEINKYLPELVQLQQVVTDTAEQLGTDKDKKVDPVVGAEAWANVYQTAMPLKNDFVFNFNEFENHKKEIHDKHM